MQAQRIESNERQDVEQRTKETLASRMVMATATGAREGKPRNHTTLAQMSAR